MSRAPKKSEYKASEAEKTEASISLAEYNRWKKLYPPVLKGWRDDSEKDFTETLRGRAGADFAQATTGSLPNLAVVESPGVGAERARIAAKTMLEGTLQGRDVKANLQTDVLAAARKQKSQTQAGLGQVARIGASNVLADASNKQLVRGAIGGALGNIAGSALKAGFANLDAGMKFFQGNKKAGPRNSGFFSDIRLKESIEYLGKSSNGHNIYTWNWNNKAVELGINDPTTGVLAQEIMETNPDTVTKGTHGYYVVNYSLLFGGG